MLIIPCPCNNPRTTGTVGTCALEEQEVLLSHSGIHKQWDLGFATWRQLNRSMSTCKGLWSWAWLPALKGTVLSTFADYCSSRDLLAHQFWQRFRSQCWAILWKLRLQLLKKMVLQGRKCMVSTSRFASDNGALLSVHLPTPLRLTPDSIHFRCLL